MFGVIGVFPDGRNICSPWSCAAASRSRPGKAASTISSRARGLRAPLLAIIDGNAGLRRAVELVWPRAAVQRCCVHKLRNLERKAPKHALAEIRDDFHRIAYTTNADAARTAYTAFERTWAKRCPRVVTSLREGGDELLTFFRFPKTQWKTLRTTNTIERLHEEFRRRVKTQGSLPSEDAVLALLFQPRCERADQVAPHRRLVEDRDHAQPAYSGSMMSLSVAFTVTVILTIPSTRSPRERRRRAAPPSAPARSCATHLLEETVSDLSRAAKIPVLCCAALQDTAARPTSWLRYKGVFHQKRVSEPSRYTAPPAAFTLLRGSR